MSVQSPWPYLVSVRVGEEGRRAHLDDGGGGGGVSATVVAVVVLVVRVSRVSTVPAAWPWPGARGRP